MNFQDIPDDQRSEFDKAVSHPLQSFEWGEFREKTGIKVIRRGIIQKNKIANAYQLTIHNALFGFKIGYLAKGNLPNKDLINDLLVIGKQNNCVYILLEPHVEKSMVNGPFGKAQDKQWSMVKRELRPSFHPLFTKHSFILDLDKSEEELLSGMHPKTRYNIKIAQKHGVEIKEDNSQKAFEKYLQLTWETTNRQKFYAHDEIYHRVMWQTLKANGQWSMVNGQLSAHLFTATYQNTILTTWIVFVFKDVLYYPYGASSQENREVMANNLMAWEVIKYGQKLGLKKFDMWGSLGPEPDPNDPWFGFHRFKKGYGAKLVEFVGSYDLVVSPILYEGTRIVDKARWALLKARLR